MTRTMPPQGIPGALERPRIRAPWYLSTTKMALAICVLWLIVGFTVPFSRVVTVSDQRSRAFWPLLFVCAALIVGLRVGESIPLRAPTRRLDVDKLHRALPWLMWISGLGYVAWFGRDILKFGLGTLLVAALHGSSIRSLGDRNVFSGLSQTGLVAASVCGIVLAVGNGRQRKRARRAMILLFVLTVVRTLLWSERLALLSLVLSAGATYAVTKWRARETKVRFLSRPIILVPAGIAALIVLFSGFEYTRSYQKLGDGQGWLQYGALRLGDYYTTGINNFAYSNTTFGHSSYPKYDVLTGVISGTPVLGSPFSRVFGLSDPVTSLLVNSLQPQYNTFTFFNPPVVAFGLIGGGVLVLVLGVLGGTVTQNARRGSPAILLLGYVWLGLVEMPQIFVPGESFLFIPLVGTFVTAMLCSVKQAF